MSASGAGTWTPGLGGAGFSSGEVAVLVRGVRDRQHLSALLAVLQGIRGVEAIAVQLFERPDAPLLSVRLARPLPLAAEIRGALGRSVTSCALVGGRIEVVLARQGRAGSRPEAWGAPPRVDHRARTGPAGTARPWARAAGGAPWTAPVDPEPRMPPRRVRRTEPAGTASGGAPAAAAPSSRSPHPATPVTPGPPALPADLLPATMAEAFAAEHELSVMVVGRDRRIRAAYGGLHRRSPRGRGDLAGLPVEQLTTREHRAGLLARVDAALGGASGAMVTRSGSSERTYAVTFNPVLDGERVVACMMVTRDVSRHQRDQALRTELTDVFETTFEDSPVGMALLSPTGQWLRVNGALCRLLRRDADALVGASLRELTHPDDLDRENALLYEVVASHAGGYEVEKRFVLGDDRTLRAYVRMSPIRAAQGAVRGFVAHVVDAERWGGRPAGPAAD